MQVPAEHKYCIMHRNSESDTAFLFGNSLVISYFFKQALVNIHEEVVCNGHCE